MKTPLWAATNSLCEESLPLNTYHTIPVIQGSPTEWGNLYTALKIVQGINVSHTPNHKTIVTLDLRLRRSSDRSRHIWPEYRRTNQVWKAL